MSTELSPITDRDLARFLMRSSDAIDLLLGSMAEALSGRPASDPLVAAVFQTINQIHAAIRAPILKSYPEFDVDQTR